MPPDSSDIDAALLAKLNSDTELTGYVQNLAWMDEAPPKSTRFVIVSLIDEVDEQQFERRSYEDALYLVKAVVLSTVTNANALVKSAAARIDALLENGTLTVNGYALMTMHRETRIRITEVDEVDPTVRWFHRGGQYRLVMST